MKRHRRKHSAELKARVALEAMKGIKTCQIDPDVNNYHSRSSLTFYYY